MSRRVAPLDKAPLLGYHVMASRAAVAPWTPASISGLQVWIDFSDAATLFTDAGATPVSSDGDAIYQANDKSGNGRNFQQAKVDYRMLYKTGVINGMSTGFTDEFADGMITTMFYLTQSTIFLVVRPHTLNTYGEFYCGDNSNKSYFGQTWSYQLVASTDTSSVMLTGTNGFALNTNYIFSLPYDGSSIVLYKNGADVTGSKSLTGTQSIKQIGAGIESYFCEWLVYSGALSDTDRQAVEAYLNAKWNIYEPAKAQSLEGLLSFEPEEEKLWWQGADVDALAQAQPQVELTWWDKANRVVNAALAKAKKFIDDKLYQLWQAIEDYFTYDEEE